MKISVRPVAVIGSLLLSSCSANGLLGLFGGSATGSTQGLSETIGGKWYACGMTSHYLDLTVDASGSLSGKAVERGSPVFEVRGAVTEADAFKGVIREATATVEFVPLVAGGGSILRFENIGTLAGNLRGIKGGGGIPLLMQRTIDAAVQNCPGIPMAGVANTPAPSAPPTVSGTIPGSVDFGDESSPLPGPSGTPSPSPSRTPSPAPTSSTGSQTPSPTPAATGVATPTPSPRPSATRTPTPTPTPANTIGGGFSDD